MLMKRFLAFFGEFFGKKLMKNKGIGAQEIFGPPFFHGFTSLYGAQIVEALLP
jgi:hypothetical protein